STFFFWLLNDFDNSSTFFLYVSMFLLSNFILFKLTCADRLMSLKEFLMLVMERDNPASFIDKSMDNPEMRSAIYFPPFFKNSKIKKRYMNASNIDSFLSTVASFSSSKIESI